MKDDSLSCVGGAVIMLGAAIVGYIVNGLALSTLWSWFVVPVFSVPNLTIPYAIGISIVVEFLVSKRASTESKKQEWAEVFVNIFIGNIVYPIMVLGVAWIVLQFV